MKTCSVCKRSWEDDFRICPIDGIPLQEAPAGADPFVGKSIGNCRLVEKIADGDLGPIYKAEEPTRGTVAAQVVPPDRVSSPILMEAFSDAVKLATQLTHVNVVRIFGVENTPDGTMAVLMEYVQGSNLQVYRQKHPNMSPAEACGLIRQAAEGLAAAHRISMLHGALHPTRILVAADGTVKVAGFHRSGLREGTDALTATAATLPYLAPEQLGIVRDIPPGEFRTDVYGLGVVFYELLANRLPFEAKTVQDLATIMEGSPPLPPNFSNPQITPMLSRVVLRALAMHPTERQSSMAEFIKELDAAGQSSIESPRSAAPAQFEAAYSAPPPRADSGLFAPQPPSPRRESAESPWPESAQQKDSSGEGSVFSWFKTQAHGRRSGGGSEPRPSRSERDDSSLGMGPPRRRAEEDYQERTVVVSGEGKRGKKRSLSDTFFGPRVDDMSGTSTGTLPRRRLSNKVYIILSIAGVLVLGGVITLFLYFGSSSTGTISINSSPPGAQVYINEEFRGGTPLPVTELKSGVYQIRVQLDGYETKIDTIEVEKNHSIQKEYILARQAPLIAPAPPLPMPNPPVAIPSAPAPVAPTNKAPQFAGIFNTALRSHNLFPPAADNAWDIQQRWQAAEGGSPSTAVEEAKRSFCQELSNVAREKLGMKDFSSMRIMLDQIRLRAGALPCAPDLQSAYEGAVSQSVGDLRASARAAMDRQSYVTPENDNALRFVRLVLAIDPQDPEAKAMEGEIFNRAWELAQAKSNARQHQEALDIYNQLKRSYPQPPVGMTAIDQNIEKQARKLNLANQLRASTAVQVRHDHGRNLLILKKKECTGLLRVDGFAIEYQSAGGHSFKLAYSALKATKVERDKITIEGSGVPDGKIELWSIDKSPLMDLQAKVLEFQKLNAEYLR
jgi:serine/threonine protein kinase/tetratricopeptide (TPR) repeat protein